MLNYALITYPGLLLHKSGGLEIVIKLSKKGVRSKEAMRWVTKMRVRGKGRWG